MATLLSCASGNLTSASTWALVNAASLLNSESNSTALTTSAVASSTFTPGAVTIDGIAVKLTVRTGTTGTITIDLAQGGVQVSGAVCTLNVADLPVSATADLNGGWVFFKFAAPVLLVAATLYTVRGLTSSSNQVSLFRDATAGNWSRMLRTTTTQAPIAGDNMVITGEYTGAGTSNTLTVTMDSTAATDYGANVTGAAGLVAPGVAICSKGVLTWGTTAATNYILRVSGSVIVYSGGTLSIGTPGTPIPRDSTAWLEVDCAADGDFRLLIRNLGTYNHQGLSRTSGKDIVGCKLNANAAVNATTLNVDTDTGWLDNDVIVVAPTTRTSTQFERGALNGNAGASSLTVDGFAGAGGGLAFAHGGVDPVIAEIINLTRNTGFRNVSSSFFTTITIEATAIVDIDWAEFYYCGYDTNQNPSFFIKTTTGSFSIAYSSVHDPKAVSGLRLFDITFSTNNNYHFLNVVATQGGYLLQNAASTGTNWSIDGLWFVGGGANGANGCLSLNDLGGSVKNIVITGSPTGGVFISPSDLDEMYGLDFSNWSIHSNGGVGIPAFSPASAVLSNIRVWRNNSNAMSQNNSNPMDTRVVDYLAFGNNGYNFGFVTGTVWLDNPIMGGDTTFASTYGFSGQIGAVIVNGGQIGVVSGILVDHTLGEYQVGNGDVLNSYFNNTSFGVTATTVVFSSSRANLKNGSAIHIQRKNGVSGANITYFRDGNIEQDAATFKTAAPSEKLSPLIFYTGGKLASQVRLIPVAAGQTLTVSVWVQKNGSYAGAQPRLMQVGDAAAIAGMGADVALDTMTVGTGIWENLTGIIGPALSDTAFRVYIDCDGTAGSVYVDDWAAA